MLAGCVAPPPSVSLPPIAQGASSDPLEAALYGAADAFAAPARLRANPAAAAVAVAQLEYLAVEIPAGRYLRPLGSLVGPALQSARYEMRRYLGIPQTAAPQAVIDALTAAVSLSSSGPAAAAAQLPASLFPEGGTEAWHRLADMPRLPQVNSATQMALRQWLFGPPEQMIDVGDD